MKYAGIDPTDGLHRFETARPFQGADHYAGASGAPIAGPDGVFVSMLVGGHKKEQILYGIPLASHAATLLAK